MRQVIVTEFAKLRRSAVPWVTLGGLMCGPLALALFIWIVRNPDRAASLGLLGTKANLSGLEASWTAYGSYLSIVIGAGGMILVAFIVAFLILVIILALAGLAAVKRAGKLSPERTIESVHEDVDALKGVGDYE